MPKASETRSRINRIKNARSSQQQDIHYQPQSSLNSVNNLTSQALSQFNLKTDSKEKSFKSSIFQKPKYSITAKSSLKEQVKSAAGGAAAAAKSST